MSHLCLTDAVTRCSAVVGSLREFPQSKVTPREASEVISMEAEVLAELNLSLTVSVTLRVVAYNLEFRSEISLLLVE